jgi:hypothetical protein
MAEKEIATMEVNDERALFESAWRAKFDMPEHAEFSKWNDGSYTAPSINDYFDGWCMGRAAIAQRAASAPDDPISDSELKRLHRILTLLGVHGANDLDADTSMACFWSLIGELGNKLETATQQAAPEAPASAQVLPPWPEPINATTHEAQTIAPWVTDKQIVDALHSLGINTEMSKYGFGAIQVRGTNVPNIRRLVAKLAKPESPASAQPVAAAPADLIYQIAIDHKNNLWEDAEKRDYDAHPDHWKRSKRIVYAAPAAPVAQAFPERDASKPAEQQGMYRKFIVERTDGQSRPGNKHYGCRYFVLDLTHDQHAPAAMRAYASACAVTHPQLAADIVAEFGAPVAQATTASASIGDDPKFRDLLHTAQALFIGDATEAKRALIAYIDSRAPAPSREAAITEAREYQRKVDEKIIARRDAEIADLRAALAQQGASQDAAANAGGQPPVWYVARSVDGKQHDTGRVERVHGGFLASTYSVAEAQFIADALNWATAYRAPATSAGASQAAHAGADDAKGGAA